MESLFELVSFLFVAGKNKFSEMNKDIAGCLSKVAKDVGSCQ